MPRVVFTQDFDWAPPEFNGRWLVAYKAGWSGLVTTPCATVAIAAGKAIGKAPEQGSRASETGGNTTGRAQRRKAGPRAER